MRSGSWCSPWPAAISPGRYATDFWFKLNDQVWTALTFVLGLSFRQLAIRYRWEMPKFVFNSEKP